MADPAPSRSFEGFAAIQTRLSVARCAITGAFATLLFFGLCWVFAALGLPLTHMFIGLFTSEPVGSAASLGVGSLLAFVSGGIIGAVIAHCYNLAGRFLGR